MHRTKNIYQTFCEKKSKWHPAKQKRNNKNSQRRKHADKKQFKEKKTGLYTRKGVGNGNENLQLSLKISVAQYVRKNINMWDKTTNHFSLRVGNDGRSATNQKEISFLFSISVETNHHSNFYDPVSIKLSILTHCSSEKTS